MKPISNLIAAFAILIAAPVMAHDIQHGEVVIDHPIMHPPLGRPDMTVGYMRLVNKGDHADRLISASAAIAGKIEIHTNIMDGDVMRMRKLDGVDIPAGAAIAFEPGGYHLMIFGLTEKLITGEEIPVTLEFEKAGKVVTPFWVEPRATQPAQNDHDNHQMDHDDMDHGDMDHGDMDNGDMDHGDMHHGHH